MFITIYTDASFHLREKKGIVAWIGKCSAGTIEGSVKIDTPDVNHAEMSAILFSIKDALKKFPDLEGFFINSDNMGCVRSFWTFARYDPPYPTRKVFVKIQLALGDRWIRTKHVKAHTEKKDVRSYLNRRVDQLTREN